MLDCTERLVPGGSHTGPLNRGEPSQGSPGPSGWVSVHDALGYNGSLSDRHGGSASRSAFAARGESATRGVRMFDSVNEVQQRFGDARYIATRRLATVVYLAARTCRTVLLEGPAGLRKTER